MTRRDRDSHERRSTEIGARPFQREDDSENDAVRAADNDSYAKGGSASSQKRWISSEDSSRPHSQETKKSSLRRQGNIEDTETESPGVKSNDQPGRIEEHSRGKARYFDIRANEERVVSKSLGGRRRKRSKRPERRRLGERSRTVDGDHRDRIDSGSSQRRYSGEGSVSDKSQRRKKNASRADNEVPITEILKKAEENARTKYTEPVPLPELTTDTIYIQGKNGFNAVKIGGLRRILGNDTTRATKGGIAGEEGSDFARTRTHTLIRVAITAQKFWKSTGLVFQGLLGGMAFLHFIMMHVFFNTSMEFMSNYSIFSEIYTNMFSFLIALCVISIFDKFDVTRLDMDHLREIYTDHAKSTIAVPLYLATFGLHQASLKVDDQLALIQYCNVNETIWSNSTMLETFLDELSSWQKITLSKDLLVMLAWLFVALGTRDNMLLMHLESMENYASNVQSPR